MESALDILPKEVIHKVFSNLSVAERLEASLVCKKWLNTLNCKSLLRDIIVHISNAEAVCVFASMTRNFLNFSFEFNVIDSTYYKLFQQISFRVEHLSFHGCKIEDRDIASFSDFKYDNLKVLKIIDCELWIIFPSAPNLIDLELTGKSTITDDGFAILQKTMKRLKSLRILCPVSYDRKVIKRFYPNEMTYEIKPSSLILSSDALKSFLCERVSTLKEIYLHPGIISSGLREISSIKNLCLHKIDLSNAMNCVDALIDLFKNQLTLKSVYLNGIRNINDSVIDALCFLLPNVEEISLHECPVSNNSLKKLYQLTELNKLDIGVSNTFAASALNGAISNFKATKIKWLNIAHRIREPQDTFFDILFKQCSNLVHLDIGYNEIPDAVVHIVSQNLVHLEHFCINHSCITDYALTGCKEPLNSGGTNFKDKTSLSNLKNLRVLKLSHCGKISEDAVLNTIKFQYLEFLQMNGHEFKLETFETLLSQNPRLKDILFDIKTVGNSSSVKIQRVGKSSLIRRASFIMC